MILKSKICGVSDSKTLNFIVNHNYPPQFIGLLLIIKIKRYVDNNKLKKLLKIDKKNCLYVAVLVNPDENILEEIKDLPFDYYQLYDCDPIKIKKLKKNIKKKSLLHLQLKILMMLKNIKCLQILQIFICLIVKDMKKVCLLIIL